jgi:LL-diaminopimelate aminotransferase
LHPKERECRFQLRSVLRLSRTSFFAAIDKAKEEVRAKGMDIISLGIGDPDLPTPDFIIDALNAAARKPANHQYPSYIGLRSFRQSVADWYKRRFGVVLDPDTEVVSLIGSKEGIAHFPWLSSIRATWPSSPRQLPGVRRHH